jgi:hypothetical protein
MLRSRSPEEPTRHLRRWPTGQPTTLAGRPRFVDIRPPRDEGRPPPVRQGSPCTRGCGTHSTHALSPRPTIGKEHQSVMPTCPTMGILTPRKVTVQRQLVVPLSSSDDDLPLVKHDARVDPNLGGARIRYTHEPALVSA